MTLAPKIAIPATLLVIGAGGALLWAKYGTGVFFDALAASFIGCFG
ncbi:MAG TPA: hypothetical protein VFB16_08940 [Bauldia sp.]|nr:hypothetical protein [Bauldia sp.]